MTTMMMMAVRGLLQVVGLLVARMSTGMTSKKMRSEFVAIFSFLLFLVLYAKGGQN